MASTYSEQGSDLGFPVSFLRSKKKDWKFLDDTGQELDKTTFPIAENSSYLETKMLFTVLYNAIIFFEKEIIPSIEISKIENWFKQIKMAFSMNEFDIIVFNEKFNSLKSQFHFRSDEKLVREFLMSNYHLIPFINETYNQIRKFFPSNDLLLELTSDYDESKEEDLFINIRTSLAPGDAIKVLRNFDETWFIEESSNNGGKVWVNLEFQ